MKSNREQVSALAKSVLLSLGDVRVTSDYLRGMLDDIKTTIGCADCGYRADARALDWAHVDASTKYRTRSGNVEQPSDLAKPGRDGYPRYSQTVILAEIAKCDVLCATCHRVRTFEGREITHPARPRQRVALADMVRPWCECGHHYAPHGPSRAPRCAACEGEYLRTRAAFQERMGTEINTARER